MGRRKKGDPPRVVRRAASERKKMPADLEAFAAGDDDAIWRRRQRRRLQDPRPVVLVPGVANRDARAVYEARHARITAAITAEDRAALALEMAEASQLRVWRGHSIVGWDAFVEAVLGLDPAEAEALREEGGGGEPLEDELGALWMRADAGIVEAEGRSAAVRLRGGRLCLELVVDTAAAALAHMGRRAAPLVWDNEETADTVVDRPKGLPRLGNLDKPGPKD